MPECSPATTTGPATAEPPGDVVAVRVFARLLAVASARDNGTILEP